jgi:hypothetical protein
MRELLYSWVALSKHRTNAAFQKLCFATQSPDQTVTSIGAYIITTCEGTGIADYNKCMFFRTKLRLDIRAAIWKGEDYLTFDACLKAGVEAKTALYLDAEYNKAFKSAPEGQAAERAGKDKGKSNAYHHDSGESHSSQGALQCSHDGFRG